MSFGNKLRHLIDEKETTQKKVAMDLSMAASTLGGYVQNTSEPDFETLKILALYFDVTTDYLLDINIGDAITELECELLRIFRTLPIESQRICVEQCRAFLKHSRKKPLNP